MKKKELKNLDYLYKGLLLESKDNWQFQEDLVIWYINHKVFHFYPPGEQPVNVFPEITIHQRNINDQFILIGCDGLFEVLSSEMISNNIQKSLNSGLDTHYVLEKLLDDCMCPVGGIRYLVRII